MNEFAERLNSYGLTLEEFLQLNEVYVDTLIALSESDWQKYRLLYDAFKESRRRNCSNTQIKAKALEELSRFLFARSGGVFDVALNMQTSTNEIDLVVVKNKKSILFGNTYNYIPNRFLCECKNYGKKVDVTFVGKFYSLLQSCRCKFGIIISHDGVTGKQWADATGLIKKLFLKSDTQILSIDDTDLQKIYDRNTPLLSIIQQKSLDLQLDTTLEFQSHELQGVLNESFP